MHSIFKDHVKENPKIIELISVLEESKVPAIIWCRYRPERNAIIEAVESMGKTYVCVDGSRTKEERDADIRRFQEGEVDYVIANQQTGGVGLTMTRAQLVVYYSNTFSFIDRDQSEDRAHRIGQKNAVLYVDLVMDKSIDNLIMTSVQEKKDISEFVRGKFRSGDILDL